MAGARLPLPLLAPTSWAAWARYCCCCRCRHRLADAAQTLQRSVGRRTGSTKEHSTSGGLQWRPCVRLQRGTRSGRSARRRRRLGASIAGAMALPSPAAHLLEAARERQPCRRLGRCLPAGPPPTRADAAASPSASPGMLPAAKLSAIVADCLPWPTSAQVPSQTRPKALCATSSRHVATAW